MISTEFDYSDCKYDPRKKSFVKDIEAGIPQFANYEEHDGEDRHNLFAYIVALYDKNSPLWAAVPDYFERKVKAAQTCNMAKAQTRSGGFAQWVRDVLESQDDKVNDLIVAYLADIGDIDYAMLIAELSMFYNAIRDATKPGSHGSSLFKVATDLSESIKKKTKVIFGSGEKEELQRLRVALYEKAEKDHQKGLLPSLFYFEGSMNFTYSGIYRNKEKITCNASYDNEGRHKIMEAYLEFERIWHNLGLEEE